jgi:carbamoylphosphate synthase small subunit
LNNVGIIADLTSWFSPATTIMTGMRRVRKIFIDAPQFMDTRKLIKTIRFDGLAKERITTDSLFKFTKTTLEVQPNSPSRVKLSTKSNNENFNQGISA